MKKDEEDDFPIPTSEQVVDALAPLARSMQKMNADSQTIAVGCVVCVMARGPKAVALRAFMDALDAYTNNPEFDPDEAGDDDE